MVNLTGVKYGSKSLQARRKLGVILSFDNIKNWTWCKRLVRGSIGVIALRVAARKVYLVPISDIGALFMSPRSLPNLQARLSHFTIGNSFNYQACQSLRFCL